jgi:type IV secretion system protein VirB6
VSIATAFETKIDSLLGVWINGVSGSFVTALQPLAGAGFTVYIILLGWQIMRGEITEPVSEIAKRVLRLAVIIGIACGALGYQTYVIGLSNAVTGGLIATVSSGTGTTVPTTIGGVIDNVMTPYTQLFQLLQQNASTTVIPSVSLLLAAVFVALAEFLVVIVSLGFYLLAKVELALCLAVGPIFVLLATFESTREWTRKWIGQLFHYSMQQALIAAAVSLLASELTTVSTTAFNNYQNNGAGSVFADVLAVFVVSLCVVVLVWNIGALTQALTGAVGSIGHSAVQGAPASAKAAGDKAAMVAKAVATKGASLGQDLARRALSSVAQGARTGIKQLRGGGGGTTAADVPAAQQNVIDNL